MVMAESNRVIPIDQLTPEDLSALRWAHTAGRNGGVSTTADVEIGPSGEPVGIRASVVASILSDWEAAGRPQPEHHIHRTAVTLVDGTRVVGVTFVADNPYRRDDEPTYGLYLDDRWDPPWPHNHVDWPDFGVPRDGNRAAAQIRSAFARAAQGEEVEVGCYGGLGRTGTVVACMATLSGVQASDAVAWVRANYDARAVETPEQERWVHWFAAEEGGR